MDTEVHSDSLEMWKGLTLTLTLADIISHPHRLIPQVSHRGLTLAGHF